MEFLNLPSRGWPKVKLVPHTLAQTTMALARISNHLPGKKICGCLRSANTPGWEHAVAFALHAIAMTDWDQMR